MDQEKFNIKNSFLKPSPPGFPPLLFSLENPHDNKLIDQHLLTSTIFKFWKLSLIHVALE